MNILLVATSLALLWNISIALPTRQSTLKLVHALFRHGDRNPDEASLWTTNPYYDESFYPEGYGQLTNKGKRTEYHLGTILRSRYDSFLGETWNINYMDIRSTDFNRTKMSAELVAAGLWPPKEENIWKLLLSWQPIPYNYVPSAQDVLLSAWNCPSFYPELGKVLSSPEIESYLTGRYQGTMEILSANTGVDTTDYFSAYAKYFGLLVQEQLGFPLQEWTEQIYPEPLHSIAVDMYYIMTNTTAQRKLMAGNLVKKILTDTQNLISGTLTPSTRKVFLYSAHELNVASTLLSLDAFKIVDIPAYGSSAIFEVHEINGVYGIKLFYIDYTTNSPHGPLVIPGCSEFCPFDEFYSLVEEILPTSDVCNLS